uniref:Uncharacterized protein n=1 Tax=Arundo donax TaxID=35708 RepID=A0A0A9ANL9_ARUDO
MHGNIAYVLNFNLLDELLNFEVDLQVLEGRLFLTYVS